jgi:DNA-3-methyladenine glycosylase II
MTTPAAALDEAYEDLFRREPSFREVADAHGRPDPFVWAAGGAAGTSRFAALVLHVVAQQISTTVALVLFDRVRSAAGGRVEPGAVAALGTERLHALGLSRAKAASVVDLAERHLSGALDTDDLDGLDDEAAVAALTSAKGVGPWTTQMFLIHQLRRPDVLPAGDLGIRRAVQVLRRSPGTPSTEEVGALGRRWAPWRTYAAALLWASLHPAAPSSVEAEGARTAGR